MRRRRFQQSKHDGLCGLYATLNALRFLEAARGERLGSLPDSDTELFNLAVQTLSGVRGVSLEMIRNDRGFPEHHLATMLGRLQVQYDIPIKIGRVSRIKPKRESFSEVQSMVDRLAQEGPWAIVAGCERNGDAFDHWTVVAKQAGQRPIRLDSWPGERRRGVLDGRAARHFASGEGLFLTLA